MVQDHVWRRVKLERQRTRGSKGVTSGELPHARQELGETARETGHADNDIGGVDVSCINIVQGKNECS